MGKAIDAIKHLAKFKSAGDLIVPIWARSAGFLGFFLMDDSVLLGLKLCWFSIPFLDVGSLWGRFSRGLNSLIPLHWSLIFNLFHYLLILCRTLPIVFLVVALSVLRLGRIFLINFFFQLHNVLDLPNFECCVPIFGHL